MHLHWFFVRVAPRHQDCQSLVTSPAARLADDCISSFVSPKCTVDILLSHIMATSWYVCYEIWYDHSMIVIFEWFRILAKKFGTLSESFSGGLSWLHSTCPGKDYEQKLFFHNFVVDAANIAKSPKKKILHTEEMIFFVTYITTKNYAVGLRDFSLMGRWCIKSTSINSD